MICPYHRIALTSVGAKGGLKCPKCGYLVKIKDLRVFNRVKRKVSDVE